MPLPTEVKYFHSDMPGAPQLSGVAGTYIDVLDACLVNGFGLKTVDTLVVEAGVVTATLSTGHSAEKHAVVEIAGASLAELNGQHKVLSTTPNTVVFEVAGVADGAASGSMTLTLAPAGWLKAFSGTHLAAYQSANPEATGMYLQVNDTTAFTARVQGFETMSSVSDGLNPFPRSGQTTAGLHNYKANASSGTRPWFVIANDRWAYVGVCAHTSYPTGGYSVSGFGDLCARKTNDAGRFCIRCSDLAANSVPWSGSIHSLFDGSENSTLFYAARDYSGLGMSPRLQNLSFAGRNGGSASSGYGPIPYPNGPDQGLIVAPQHVLENASKCLRGHYPGLYTSPQNLVDQLGGGKVGVFMEQVRDLPGKTLAVIPTPYASTSIAAYGFIDVIGPWGN